MNEETTKPEGEEQKGADENNKDGLQSETAKETERINSETEGLDKAIAEKKNADARAKIAGVTDTGTQPPKKVEETPQEYAARVMKGEL